MTPTRKTTILDAAEHASADELLDALTDAIRAVLIRATCNELETLDESRPGADNKLDAMVAGAGHVAALLRSLAEDAEAHAAAFPG